MNTEINSLSDLRAYHRTIRAYAANSLMMGLTHALQHNVADGWVDAFHAGRPSIDVYCKIGIDGKPYWRVDGHDYVDTTRALDMLFLRLM